MKVQPTARPSSLSQRSILNDIEVKHGPVAELGLFFLHAEMLTRQHGVALSFCEPAELVIANKANTANWRPLVPMCDPANGLATADTCINVIGRNEAGEVVTANSAIKYDWRKSNLVEEATSLRLFYGDPERMKQAGEACIVTSEEPREIRGITAYSGAAWVRPDYRGRGLSEILPRFIKACALARWELDWIFGLMAEDVQVRGFATRFGYDRLAWEANWMNSLWGAHYRMAVLWTDSMWLAKDFRQVLDRQAAPQVDGVVLDRNAQ